jgi:hypothetical protein
MDLDLTSGSDYQAKNLRKPLISTVLCSAVVPDRIRTDQHLFWLAGSGSRRAKITHKSEENSSLEVLDVLF